MKTENLLLIGGTLAGAYFLFRSRTADQQPAGSGSGGFNFTLPGSNSPGLDFSGLAALFSSIGSSFGGNSGGGGIFTLPSTGAGFSLDEFKKLIPAGGLALSDFTGSLDIGNAKILDEIKKLIPANPLATPTIPGFPAIDPFGGTTKPGESISDIIKTAADATKTVAESAMIGAGTILGFRTLAPVAPVVGRAIASGIGATAPLIGESLMAPVTFGVASTTLVPLAAGLGIGIGSLFNITPPGKALLEWSGEQGVKFADTSLGQKVFGVAQVNTSKSSVQYIQEAQAKGLSGQAAINYAKDRLGSETSGGPGDVEKVLGLREANTGYSQESPSALVQAIDKAQPVPDNTLVSMLQSLPDEALA